MKRVGFISDFFKDDLLGGGDINDNNLAIIIIDLLLYFDTKFPAYPPSKDQGNDQVTFANVTFNGESVNSYIIIIIKGI